MTAKSKTQRTDARLVSRRAFLDCSSAAIAGAALGKAGPARACAAKGESIKVGLYSITHQGLWYRGKALTLEEVIRRAKQHGFDGIEIDGKRPHGNPLDMPASRCREINRLADGEGIDIYAVAANNDFSSPVPEYRECQLVYLRELVRMTSELDVNLLRVFLAWPGVTRHDHVGRYDVAKRAWQEAHKEFSADQIWSWCREGLVESARFAGEFGVTLALQNHRPVIEGYGDVLRMIREVDSPHLKACVDAPLLKDRSDAATYRAALDVGRLQVLSHFGGEYERNAEGRVCVAKGAKNLPAFVRAMSEIGYQGYLGYELCHPLPVVNGQTVGIDFADRNAQLAAEYLRSIIADVQEG